MTKHIIFSISLLLSTKHACIEPSSHLPTQSLSPNMGVLLKSLQTMIWVVEHGFIYGECGARRTAHCGLTRSAVLAKEHTLKHSNWGELEIRFCK